MADGVDGRGGGRPGGGHGAGRRLRRGGDRGRRRRSGSCRPGSTTATPPPSGWPGGRRTTSCARWPGSQPGDELVVLGAGGGVGLAAVSLGRHLGAIGDGGGVVRRPSSRRPGPPARPTSSDHTAVDLRAALREVLPEGADVVVDPVGGDLAEPALRSLRWGGRFVTVGYASGEIPRIPLNLVLLKGCQVLGFQFRDFAEHCPGRAPSQRRRAVGAPGRRRGAPARRGHLRPRRGGRRPGAGGRRPGGGEGRPRGGSGQRGRSGGS